MMIKWIINKDLGQTGSNSCLPTPGSYECRLFLQKPIKAFKQKNYILGMVLGRNTFVSLQCMGDHKETYSEVTQQMVMMTQTKA